tara:strand:- start:354 stop:473 length:120 start_codon:yes stop_codon:yes gene_type:complete
MLSLSFSGAAAVAVGLFGKVTFLTLCLSRAFGFILKDGI